MNVAIIIPTIHARPDLLHRCIELCADTAPDAQLIVADYGGTFSENCNEGARQTDADILVFLNDDTEPQPGWLDRMLEVVDTHHIVGARLLYPNGRVQHSGIYFEGPPLTAVNRLWDVPSQEVDAVTGACLLVGAAVFRELGGFDESFRNGLEDVDLCLRARLRGCTIWYCAEATLIHHESSSGDMRWRWVRENIQTFEERWHVGETWGDSEAIS